MNMNNEASESFPSCQAVHKAYKNLLLSQGMTVAAAEQEVEDSESLFFLNPAGELHVKSPITGRLYPGREGLERLANMAVAAAAPTERLTSSGATQADIARLAQQQRRSGLYGLP